MSLQFILAKSGYGKTTLCYSQIAAALSEKNDSTPLVLLVPEQATYQAEKAILSYPNIDGYHRLNVLSFNRLQHKLSDRNLPSINNTTEQMILSRIVLESASELKLLKPTASLPNLVSKLTAAIKELKRSTPDIEQAKEQIQAITRQNPDSLTSLKYSDIALVLDKFHRFIENRFTDPDIELNRICANIKNATFLKNANIWVDGFSGFNVIETAVLSELIKNSKNTKISLCLNPADLCHQDISEDQLIQSGIFYPTIKTYHQLLKIAEDMNIPTSPDILLSEPKRFASSKPLAHIENNIFTDFSQKLQNHEGIKILETQDARAEINFTADQISKMVRQKNLRYRDIAVIVTDIDAYSHYIKAVFRDYQIPFFIDKPKPLSTHPAAFFIRSALHISAANPSATEIITYLKSTLAGLDEDEVNTIENYCIAFGLTTRDFLSERSWNFDDPAKPSFDEKKVNSLRKRAIKPLKSLSENLTPQNNKITARIFGDSLMAFLEQVHLKDSLDTWHQQALDAADFLQADEHQQFFEKLLTCCDQLCEIFADYQASPNEFAAILNSSLSKITIAFIPPTLDQVLVGSIERSRHPDLSAVFLVGTGQKNFPLPLNKSSLLTDRDRKIAFDCGLDFQTSTADQILQQKYLSYIAFTRPAKYLYITYPLSDYKGAKQFLSNHVTELINLFTDLTIEPAFAKPNQPQNIYTKTQLTEFATAALKCTISPPDHQPDPSLFMQLIKNDELLSQAATVADRAVNYKNAAELNKTITDKLFANGLKTSATALGNFAKCPYKYFANHILRLKERPEFKLRPLDLGTLYHDLLDKLITKLLKEKSDITKIDDSDLEKMTDTIMSDLIESDPFINAFKNHRAHNFFIIEKANENIKQAVLAIKQMITVSSFRPQSSEAAFGSENDPLGQIVLNDQNSKIFLTGKIDRIDTAEINGKKYALIIDYKKTGKTFSWSNFANALNLQLAIYLLAAAKSKKNFDLVAAAFFVPIEVSPKKTEISKIEKSSAEFDYRANGIYNSNLVNSIDNQITSNPSPCYNISYTRNLKELARYNTSGALTPEDFQNFLAITEQKIKSLARKIISGCIDINPYKLSAATACKHCPYKSLCRFDWQINNYNNLKNVTKSQLLTGQADDQR
ncbi:MAG: exodeoxyribonuclease V subunit gamma [Phycisphaerae bacterium]|nr:exodeoxyribonuclease V subunit gamma [Phycisphaerae bacterium]